MSVWIPNLLFFALDLSEVIGFVIAAFIALVSLLGFLKDKLQQAQPADGNQPRRPARQREGNLQSEIDRFLNEVGGKSSQRAREEPMEIIEVNESPRQRPRRVKAQSQAQKPAAQARRKPGAAIAEREGPGSDDLGSDVRQHVSEHMEKGRVARSVGRHLSHDVDQSVSRHLGKFAAEESRESAGGARAIRRSIDPAAIVNLLSSPAGILQAVIMSEILGRPKARQK